MLQYVTSLVEIINNLFSRSHHSMCSTHYWAFPCACIKKKIRAGFSGYAAFVGALSVPRVWRREQKPNGSEIGTTTQQTGEQKSPKNNNMIIIRRKNNDDRGRLKIKCVLRKFLYEHQPTPELGYSCERWKYHFRNVCGVGTQHHIDNGCCTKLSKQ